jgi:outer membrane protein insertion porin family
MKQTGIFLCLFFVFLSSSVFAQDADKIAKIEITGNERIDTGLIANSIKTKAKETYDVNKLREDMKNIYKTGFFSDVQIDVRDTPEGKIVTFVVIERPPIKAIYLAGNKKIKTADIRDKLKIQTNTVLNIEKVKESLDEIKKLYASKGYYAAKVSYEIDYGDAGLDTAVKFFIEEPVRSYVRKITFTGNKAFKGSALQNYMRTKEKGWFSFFTGSGTLDEDALEEDKKNIEAFYQDNGYIRIKVGVPDIVISKDGKSINVTIPLDEGDVYKIGTIDFTGDVLFTKDEVTSKMRSKPGAVFRSSLYQQDMLMVTDMYRDQGYAFCDIAPLTMVDDKTKTVNFTFQIEKKKQVFFNRVNIAGNVKSRDKVVRRELRFAEGDRFSATKIKESQRRLRNTTFFKNVDMKIAETDQPDKVNMDITVEEKPTGSLSLGLGYSSTDSVILSGSISQDNFLGTGRRLFLEAAVSGITQHFRFSYLDPYFLDMNLGFGINLFNFRRIMDTYEYKKMGGGFSLTRPLTDYVKGGFAYRLESTDVYNIALGSSPYIWQQEGTKVTSATTFSVTRNTIDDIMNPSHGSNSQAAFEIAGGPLGGDNDYFKFMAFYGQYFPVKFMDSAIFLKGTMGTIMTYGGTVLPIYEKFYVGGIDTVRGFKYGEAGPVDYTGQVTGGKNQLYFNAEWIFTVFKPAGIKGVLFYDLGAASDDTSVFQFSDLRSGAGIGMRWLSPMGPIRLELGFNVFPKPGEKRQVFDFSMGTRY